MYQRKYFMKIICRAFIFDESNFNNVLFQSMIDLMCKDVHG